MFSNKGLYMYDLKELEEKILNWRKVRRLDSQEPKDAFLKLAEEFGEISQALNKQDDLLLADAIGDTMVCLIGLANAKNLELGWCLQVAWEDIKDRRGMLKDGIFVKYRDLLPEEQKLLDESIKDER